MTNNGLYFIGAVLLIGVVVYGVIQFGERLDRNDAIAQAEADREQRNNIQVKAEQDRTTARDATVRHLRGIAPFHPADCKTNTTLWTTMGSARNRVNGMLQVLEHDASPEVLVASIEAGAVLEQAYQVAHYACKDDDGQ